MSRTIVRHSYPAALAAGLYLSLLATGAQAAPVTVSDLRVGEHPDATRVVLDITQPTGATFDVSADGKTLLVVLPEAEWRAGAFAAKHAKGLLVDFRQSVTPDGVQLSLLASDPIRIKKPFFVSPEGAQGHRIVIDLVPDLEMARTAAAADPVKPAARQIAAAAPAKEPPADIAREQRMVAGPSTIGAPAPIETAQAYSLAPNRPAIPSQTAQAVPPPMPAQSMPPKAPMAEPKSAFGGLLYVKAAVGLNVLDEASTNGSNNQGAVETDLGWMATGGLGIDLKNNFRVEGEVLYASNNAKSMTGTANGSTVNSGQADGDVSMLGFMANVAYDFVTAYPFTPYIFGGAGLGIVSLNGVKTTGNVGFDSSDTVFALQAGTGVSTDLTDRIALDLSYRYFETQEPELSDANGAPFNYEYATHMMMMGVRYKF